MHDCTPQFLALCDVVLREGSKALELPTGIVSQIEDPIYTVVAVVSPTVVFKPGDRFSVVDTWCREVYLEQSTVAYTEYDGTAGLRKHPLYIDMPIEAYISAPILVDDAVWGTLNFSDTHIRQTPFSREDVEFIESLAAKLGQAIR